MVMYYDDKDPVDGKRDSSLYYSEITSIDVITSNLHIMNYGQLKGNTI